MIVSPNNSELKKKSVLKFIFIVTILYFIQLNNLLKGQYQAVSFSKDAPICDGMGCWKQFIIDAPGKMGPNALPVPEANEGHVDEVSNFETRLIGNNASGENDQTIYMRLNSVIVPDFVSLEMNNAIIEHYHMGIERRTEDAAWHEPGKGTSAGDINVNSTIQIIRDNQYLPDIAIRFNIKTTTGKNDWDARHIDAPGYFFDMSFGKDFKLNSWIRMRLFFAGGFYCWQTNQLMLRQNDAVMGNAGASFIAGNFKMKFETGGYYGYKNNGDRPLLIRDYLDYKSKALTYRIGIEQGFHDFPFLNIFVGFIMNFDIAHHLLKMNNTQNISKLNQETNQIFQN